MNATATKTAGWTNYSVVRYTDGQQIGTAKLTDDQWSRYESMAQQPEGIIRLGSVPHDWYHLSEEYQDSNEDTVIYLD